LPHWLVFQSARPTTYYDSIALEQRDDRFVPDLLLYNSANPAQRLYIEIAVTHLLSELKASSDHRIIELQIECEADIEKIRRRRITEADARFVNFYRDGVPGVDGECTCAQRPYYCLVIYSSRKAFFFHDPLALIEDKRRRLGGKVAYARLLPGENLTLDAFRGEVFAGLIREAHERGFPVRNCFVCRFQGVPWDWADSQVHAPIYCKLLKKRCASNDAVECPKFYPVEKSAGRPS